MYSMIVIAISRDLLQGLNPIRVTDGNQIEIGVIISPFSCKVTGHLDSGNLLAIIGASGAGKTTLLNVLTGRNLKNVQVRGNVLLNGEPASIDRLTSCSSYVQQDDLFIGILTVREHLLFQVILEPKIESLD